MGKALLISVTTAVVWALVATLQCHATDNLPSNLGRLNELFPLTIIHMNDLHARFAETSERSSKCKESGGDSCIAGIARVFHTVQKLRKKHPNPLFFNVGDNYQGTIWYNYHRWRVVARFMKLLHPDAMTLGNHEFDDGLQGLRPYLMALAEEKIPTVASNLIRSKDPFPDLPRTVILERDGRSIGIIGVTADNTHELSKTESITFADSVATVRNESQALKQRGVNIILVLSHCGLEVDKRIAQEAGDHVDVIVGGHSHSFLFPHGSSPVPHSKLDNILGDYPVVVESKNGRKILIVQAYAYGKYVGRLTVYFNRDGEVKHWDGFPVYQSNRVPQSRWALKVLEPYRKQVESYGATKIAETTIDLVQDTCRLRECNLGSLVADAIADYYTNETFHPIAVINAGNFRAPIPRGFITNEEAIGASPFSNTVDLVTLRGDALWNIIEHSIVWDSVKRMNVAQVSGLRVVADLDRAPYNRVLSIEVRNLADGTKYEPLSKKVTYKLVTLSFIATGKDGFRWALERLDRKIGPLDSDVFIAYLKKLKVVNENNLKGGRMIFAVSYALCLFYSLRVLFGILVLFVTKPHTKFWVRKERPVAPDCLQNHEYGVDKYQNANGIRIHYVENGDRSKPLMVFVHGFPEFWYSWRYQLKEFSKDYWVVALDMRGYGETEKPEYRYAYRIDNMTEDIRCLVRALGRQKFTLVAHDWGAVIGWHFITKHMDMIERYIMMDAPSQKVARKLFSTSKEQFKMSWYIFFYQMPWLPEFFVRMMDFHIFKVIFKEHGGPEVVEAFKYTFSKPNGMTYPINYYRENFRFFTRKLTPPKPSTYAPGLYLLGENDLYISKETGPLMQQEFENLEFRIVPGVDHFLQQHKPDVVNQYMREFLSKK
uniref:Apyrase n=1 Tax=Anopheles stephensi TaxID=30069 RepID=A0A182YBN1_ANOST